MVNLQLDPVFDSFVDLFTSLGVQVFKAHVGRMLPGFPSVLLCLRFLPFFHARSTLGQVFLMSTKIVNNLEKNCVL